MSLCEKCLSSLFERAKMLEVPRSEFLFVERVQLCQFCRKLRRGQTCKWRCLRAGVKLASSPLSSFQMAVPFRFWHFLHLPFSCCTHFFFIVSLYCSSICSSDTPFSPLGSHPPTCHEKSDSTSYTQPVRDHQIVIVKYCVSNDDNLELCVYFFWFFDDWQYWTAHIRSIVKENFIEGYKNIRNCSHARHRFFFLSFYTEKEFFHFEVAVFKRKGEGRKKK